MKIGILGTGRIGKTLVTKLSEAGHAWRAPMAVEEWSDAKGYSQIIALDQAVLEVTTWTGRCHVNAEDGRVVNCWFTKGM